jgi:alpha-amylase
MFLAASSKAYAQFGILVNGHDVYEATHTDSFEGFEQYLAHIYVNSGDYCQLYDIGNQVAWVKTLNSSSVSAFSLQGDRYVCSASACYDFYIKIKNNADELYIGPGSGCGNTPGGGDTPGGGTDPVVPSDYASAVPSECGDIMLQAFYWNSNTDNGYGNTKWQTLSGQVSEISSYFDMVWLPPSAQASGISQGGLGYIPLIYSRQNCRMGTPTELSGLISALHNQGVRVIADIVINHIGNSSGNCDGLKTHDFGSYGSFSPTKDWLTKNDEGGCGSTGNDDDGQHDANYPSARDWDHKNVNVQKMCKAYLQWMKGEMKYDGWRYDYVGGFHVSHINAYNTASKPYFSVIEYWLGDAGVLKQRIDEAGKNTLAFDFDAKYNVYRDGIYKKNYSKCKNAGLRGKGYSKYAVTFIDNHDTFNRQNGNEPNEKGDGSSINDQSLMMRCNAYLLSMPGVPCVFWPHWVKYKSEIKKMITARKKAGIHSESTVTEEAGSGYYRATVQGKYGSVKLMLGTAANDNAPAGYTQAIKGSDYAVYYTGNGTFDVETVGANKAAQAEKFLENGQLFIRCGEHVYDAQGRLVQ